jgi:hypothetical protein
MVGWASLYGGSLEAVDDLWRAGNRPRDLVIAMIVTRLLATARRP